MDKICTASKYEETRMNVKDFVNPFFPSGNEYAAPYLRNSPFTGRLAAGIDIWLPKGRGITPELSVKLNYGGQNVFGYGFYASIPYFKRATFNGFPQYDNTDAFIHPDYGILSAGSKSRYYPQAESAFARIEYFENFFRVTDRSGVATIYNAAIEHHGFIYYPQYSRDLNGNSIKYSYLGTGEISKIEYCDIPGGGYAFDVSFLYEDRPDTAHDYSGGFLLVNSLRCRKITISTNFDRRRLLREIDFAYDNKNGYSMLVTATETGYLSGQKETAPAIFLSYQNEQPEAFLDMAGALKDTDIFNGTPISLYREGVKGLISEHGGGIFYSAPAYAEGFTPAFSKGTLINNIPGSFKANSAIFESKKYAGNFADLESDGGLQWISPDGTGYHEFIDGEFSPFKPFVGPFYHGENSEFADLFADGKMSAFTVITAGKQAEVCKSLGKGGFLSPVSVSLPESFPGKSPSQSEYTGFMNYFGDGLMHRVHLKNNMCIVFPNVGGGRFLDGMETPLNIDENFDASRVRIFDTTGSGTDDIIYIKQDHLLIFRNIAGCLFMPPLKINLPVQFAKGDSIYFADFIGDLLPQIIFIKSTASGTRAYYLRLCHNFLLKSIENGYGLSIEAKYISSARLKDGLPEVRPPYYPFVVSEIIESDGISAEAKTIRYFYKNGRYVKNTRSFYGFEIIKSQETVSVRLPKNIPKDFALPGKITISQYYIGASETPDSSELSLIGTLRKFKIFDENETLLKDFTYSYEAIALGGTFFPALLESEEIHCGKIPRVEKIFTRYDDYGNITGITQRYLPSGDENAFDGQKYEYVRQTSYSLINIDTPEFLVLGVLASTSCLAGINGEALSIESLCEYFYTNSADGEPLPLGECEPAALLHHSRDMVFAADEPFIHGLLDILTDSCEYVLDRGRYYSIGEIFKYDHDTYNLCVSQTIGNSTKKFFYDKYQIFIEKIENVLAENISHEYTFVPDYASLAYSSKTDCNENTDFYLYDAFGCLAGVSFDKPATLPIAMPADIIENPGLVTLASLDLYFCTARKNWEDCKKQIFKVAVFAREPDCQLKINNIDGFGRLYEVNLKEYEDLIISKKAVYAGELKLLEYPDFYSSENEPYPKAFAYDALGRMVKEYTIFGDVPDWRVIETFYTPWAVQVKDFRLFDEVHSFRYDLDPRGFAFTDVYEDVLRAKISIDAAGNVAAVSDGRVASLITYKYDKRKQLIKTVSADSGTIVKLYGTAGRLVYEDSFDLIKSYEYDGLGRLLKISNSIDIYWGEFAENAAVNNLNGQIYKCRDQAGEILYNKYDRFGNLLYCERNYIIDQNVSANFEYNNQSEMTAAAVGDFGLTFKYKPSGRLDSIGMKDTLLSQMEYTAAGHLSSERSGGFSLYQKYDPVTRLISSSEVSFDGVLINEISLKYTPQGNLSNYDSQGCQIFKGAYSYDAHHRLSRSTEHWGDIPVSENYTYDISGNLLSILHAENSAEKLYAFEIAADSNRLMAVTNDESRTEYSYNNFGAPLFHDTGEKLSYDEFGRLLSVTGNNINERYYYGTDDKRAIKMRAENDYTLYFCFNSFEFSRTADGIEMLMFNPGGYLNRVLLSENGAIKTFSQITDHRGSVIATADSRGNILSRAMYSPYGQNVSVINREHDALPVDYKFAGKEEDATGLNYFEARYYNAGLGRMISPDSIEYAKPYNWASLNLYTFCRNNPMTYIDPSGHDIYFFYIDNFNTVIDDQIDSLRAKFRNENIFVHHIKSADDFITAWNIMGEPALNDVLNVTHNAPQSKLWIRKHGKGDVTNRPMTVILGAHGKPSQIQITKEKSFEMNSSGKVYFEGLQNKPFHELLLLSCNTARSEIDVPIASQMHKFSSLNENVSVIGISGSLVPARYEAHQFAISNQDDKDVGVIKYIDGRIDQHLLKEKSFRISSIADFFRPEGILPVPHRPRVMPRRPRVIPKPIIPNQSRKKVLTSLLNPISWPSYQLRRGNLCKKSHGFFGFPK